MKTIDELLEAKMDYQVEPTPKTPPSVESSQVLDAKEVRPVGLEPTTF